MNSWLFWLPEALLFATLHHNQDKWVHLSLCPQSSAILPLLKPQQHALSARLSEVHAWVSGAVCWTDSLFSVLVPPPPTLSLLSALPGSYFLCGVFQEWITDQIILLALLVKFCHLHLCSYCAAVLIPSYKSNVNKYLHRQLFGGHEIGHFSIVTWMYLIENIQIFNCSHLCVWILTMVWVRFVMLQWFVLDLVEYSGQECACSNPSEGQEVF